MIVIQSFCCHNRDRERKGEARDGSEEAAGLGRGRRKIAPASRWGRVIGLHQDVRNLLADFLYFCLHGKP